MKWIGQHIYDLVARFRSDVYLEGISTSTETDMLVVDSNNKVSKRAIDAITVDVSDFMTNGVDNRVLTATGTDAMNAEANLTFDGSVLNVTGARGIVVNDSTASSATEGGNLTLASDDGAVMASGHRLGVIEFKGAEDTGNTLTTGARIEALTDAIWSASENGASLKFYTTDGNASESEVLTLDSNKLATFTGDIKVNNTTTSSASEGGLLSLISDDGAAMGDDHRLGAVIFRGAEDGSSTLKTGAKIQAFADAAWSASENGTRLEFYTMDGNASSELSLTLDSDLLATFAGAVTVTGALTGTLATAAQGNVTSLGTLTSLQVDDILLDTKSIQITGDTEDTFTMTTGAAGATTLSTVDDAGADGHFEIAADGDIILDSAGQIKLEPIGGNNILLDGVLTVDAGIVIPVAAAHDTAGVDVSIGSGATTAGTTNNIEGGSLVIHGGQGKGSGAGGDIIFKTANAGSSGSTLNALATALTISDDLSATFAGGIAGTLTTASQTNITGVGTIGTGVWEGTAIATDQQKHLATFDIRGYSTADGTNYEIPVVITDNQAPFEHNTSAGSDGLTALSVATLLRATGCVMPYAGTLKKWKGWSTHSTTSGTVNIALFRYRPDPTSASTVSLVLLDTVAHTPAGNNTVIDIEQTSFTDADVAEGDIIISGIKGSATQVTYFVSTLEVEWD